MTGEITAFAARVDDLFAAKNAEIERLTKLAKEQGQEIEITRERDERLTAENERLRRFVDFVNLWCYRESKVSAAERLEAIQYHPIARTAFQQLTPQKE